MRPPKIDPSVWRSGPQLFAAGVLLLCTAGCSIFSFKSPERPLSTRDLNARILTREYSSHFIAAVEQSADDISLHESDPRIMVNALRWKIAAADESQRAAARMAPMMSLLDTWTLAMQMKAFLAPDGAGGSLFGLHQENAYWLASRLDQDALTMVRRVIPAKELPPFQQFAETYAREHPLASLDFVRVSVVDLWSRQTGADVKLVDSLGTIPEALADVSDRLQMYSENLPSLNLWRTQLALQKSGYSAADLRVALKVLDNRLDKMSVVAEGAPQLVHGAVADVRRSVIEVLDRLDTSSAALIQSLSTERTALAADVAREREAVLIAADAQRKAITQDAERIADQVVQSSGQQLRSLAREVLLLIILLALVVLGLPFAAGYMVGRTRSRASIRVGAHDEIT